MKYSIFVYLLWLSFASLSQAQSSEPSPGACAVNDDFFKSEFGGCHELRSRLVWSAISANKMSASDRKSYCNRIEGGFEDWRLPTIHELAGVAGETRAGSHFYFDPENFSTSKWEQPVVFAAEETTVPLTTRGGRTVVGHRVKVAYINLYSGSQMDAIHEIVPTKYVICVRSNNARRD